MGADDHAAWLRRARAYPFAVPDASFLLTRGAAEPLAPGRAFAPHHYRGRVPVIACGSNRSPERLAEKFGRTGAPVLVERARLADFDVVYSAHITSYGSIPATLAASPGTAAEVAVTWLTELQLAAMHLTEAPGENYDFVELGSLALSLEGDGGWSRRLDTVFCYRSCRGALRIGDAPVALRAVRASGRTYPELSQDEMLAAVHARLGGAGSVDDFILDNIRDAARRRARSASLAADAMPFDWPHMRLIVV